MKSILVADQRTDLLATLGAILKHWGYRVIATSKVDQVRTFLQESSPCLLIISEALLADPELNFGPELIKKIASAELPVIALKDAESGPAPVTPGAIIDVPVELFELFSFIQRQVEKHPRQNLRLRLKLPGMYSVGNEEFILADVLSLSMCGLFFKASARIKKGDRVSVVFPLFGHGKEIEVAATVLYTIQPETGNNYFQGFGVEFNSLSEQQREHLQLYIREHFLMEVSCSHDGVGDFSQKQLKN